MHALALQLRNLAPADADCFCVRRSSTEQRFMEASRAHAEGKPILSDEDYDELKRQLRRDRSTVVAQARPSPLFCVPRRATFCRSLPRCDAAKAPCQHASSRAVWMRLRCQQHHNARIIAIAETSFSVQGPRCSIRSKVMYSDITIDYVKMTLLNLPAVLLVSPIMRTCCACPAPQSGNAHPPKRMHQR